MTPKTTRPIPETISTEYTRCSTANNTMTIAATNERTTDEWYTKTAPSDNPCKTPTATSANPKLMGISIACFDENEPKR